MIPIRACFILMLVSPLGCARIGGVPIARTASLEIVEDPPEEPLVWESATKPERTQWSKDLTRIVNDYFAVLDAATDITRFCPAYPLLPRAARVRAWANLIASMTYFESGWNPASYSVDVGQPNNPDTWSVGLMQMSVVDQINYRLKFGFSFDDLKRATPNLELGMAIMARQITNYGIIAIPKGGRGLYWAVLHPGGKYDRTDNIAEMTRRLKICQEGP